MERKTLILLIFIVLIASFFRLWQLDSIPPGLYPDEAINGNEAISNSGKVFYPENNGREGLFINLIALSFSIFGISIWALKIVPAIIGILSIVGLYLLTKELFLQYGENSSRNIALLSSFFLAISFWHINFSRIGFRAILVPFILVFSFYFLFKDFRTQKIWSLILAGIFFGLGFYTYISFRFAILLLSIILILWGLEYKKHTVHTQQNLQKKFILHTSYFILLIFIIVLPIGLYFLQNPQDFVGRAAPISIFAAENPVREFGKSLILHLGMFNFYGDSNWRHNFAGSPQLFWPIGILFLIGFAFSIKKLINSIRTKNCSLFSVHCSLLSWFFIMLLPGILTYEGIPHALRTIGIIPVVYIFVGLGGWYIYEKLKQIIKSRKLFISCCLLFVISITYGQFCRYSSWANLPEVEGAFSKNYVAIGNYLNSLPPEIQKYVVVNQSGVPVPYPKGIPMPAQTVMFIESTKFDHPQSIYLLPENLDQIKIDRRKGVIVLMRYEKEILDELSQKFPQGKIEEKEGFCIMEIRK